MIVLRMLSPIGKRIGQIALVNAKATCIRLTSGLASPFNILDAIAIR